MARDDLNDPLGMKPEGKPGLPHVVFNRVLVWTLGCLAGAGLLGFGLVKTGSAPLQTVAVAVIRPAEKQLLPPAIAPPAVTIDQTASISGGQGDVSAQNIEAQSGVKVIRQGGAAAPGAMIIRVPQALDVRLTPAPDPQLAEKSRFGLLPKIASDGGVAREIYARPLLTSGKLQPGAPKIAIMIGGMGLVAAATQQSVDQLPGAVTLAFAPYGPDLDIQVAHARDKGHEVILQVPMEPFDYPQNNPGPHSLRVGAEPRQTLEDLRWALGRFVGYVGVAGFLGARFTADRASLAPVLSEIGERGLLYVEDGASPQSLAPQIAAQQGLTVAKADVLIDASPEPAAVAAALLTLEALARRNGHAFGVASALPVSIEHIKRFAQALEGRGIALVPVSALAMRQQQPTAQRQ